jgi:hypothetical protein
MMDDELLSAIDNDDAVQKLGRSAVFRKLAAEYLKWKKEKEIASRYVHAYGDRAVELSDDFPGWEDEGVWPEK